MELVIAVVSGLIVAVVVGGWRWLRDANNRQMLRQRLCRHEWRSLDERNDPGSPLIFMSPYAEECVKCEARR